jgi:DNA-binding transcriptional MocR family regulator
LTSPGRGLNVRGFNCPAAVAAADRRLKQETVVEEDFPRIRRLPPYVFNIVNELKAKARARGEDIIDFGMGNPDQATPQHIVDKLVEVAQRKDTHRYSMSRGIPRLRRAVCGWYKQKYDVDLDPESQAIVTIVRKRASRTWRWRRSAPVTTCWCRTRVTRSIPMAL